jgi:hypothetical protein
VQVTFSRLIRDDRSLVPVAPEFAFTERGRIDIKLRGNGQEGNT